jgi:hypothetical protein
LEGAVLDSTKSAVVKNDGNKKAEFLMLVRKRKVLFLQFRIDVFEIQQAKPIGEPVVQNGPFGNFFGVWFLFIFSKQKKPKQWPLRIKK